MYGDDLVRAWKDPDERGDTAHPSAYQGDLNLTATVAGTTVATTQVTVLRIAIDSLDSTLLNDAEVTRAVTTTPAVARRRRSLRMRRG